MIAIAVLLHPGRPEITAAGLPTSISLSRCSQQPEGSAENPGRDPGIFRRFARENLYDPSCRIPVKGSGCAAQDFDPVGHREIEVVDLGLAVGESSGQSVNKNFDLSNSECRSRSKATNLDSCILRKVSAFLHEKAGHAGQGFPEGDARASQSQCVGPDDTDTRGVLLEWPR